MGDRKPHIIKGARQVAKNWLMKDFGKAHCKNIACVLLDASKPFQD